MARRSLPVRTRVALIAAAVVALTLVGVVAWVGSTTRGRLIEAVTDKVTARLDALDALVAAGDASDPLSGHNPDLIAQIVDEGGRVVAADAGVAGLPPFVDIIPPAGETAETRIPAPAGLIDDDGIPERGPWLFVARGLDNGGAAIVGAPLDDVEAVFGTALPIVAAATAAVVGVVAILTWLLAGFALRPVERLRVQASAVSGTDRRLTVPLTGDEVQRLAVTLNEMLTRLDEASRTRRRFVADASHELRSPVAGLRSIVDVTRAAGADLRPDVLEDLSTEIGRLEALIDDLLWLARSDEGDAPERVREEVDLDQLVRQEAAAVRRLGPIGVDTTAARPARILGDTTAMARLVRNLIDNATHHAQRIWLRSEAADGWATVGVDDDGPGIPAHERERVFERFVRLDPSRARESGGYGLGLAVAREIARAHGGDVTVVESRRGGASLEVRLPALVEIL